MGISLIDRIKDDILTARKAREAERSAFLTTLLAEASRVGKDAGNRASTDDEVVSVVKKFGKNNDEALRALEADTARVSTEAGQVRHAALTREREWIAGYLPQQASPEEVAAAIAELVAALPERSPKQMGAIMGQLQARFGANFDKATASKIVKEAVTS